MSEFTISAAIGRWLDQQQALNQLTHDRYNSGSGLRGTRRIHMAERGTADRIVRVRLDSSVVTADCAIARPVMLEVKDVGEWVLVPDRRADFRQRSVRKRFAQFLWLERQRLVGAYCCVVHSVGETVHHIEAARRGARSPDASQWGGPPR